MRTLPTGTVTYLMTDVVGSTPLWETRADVMSVAMRRHDEIGHACAEANNGHLLKERGEGDSLFFVFERPSDAARAALELQLALQREPWPEDLAIRVRTAIHTGECEFRDNDYYGAALSRCARLRAAGSAGQILLSAAAAQHVSDRLPAGSSLRDLGMHRMRDLLSPMRVYELQHPSLPAVDVPLASLNRAHHNLPIQLTSFIGREGDVRKVHELVRQHRLVTLMGSGGCGKTRLALQVASEAADEFPDGVWFADLTKVIDGEQVPAHVARTLNIPEAAGGLMGLVSVFRDRRALLLIDNCEHLVEHVAVIIDTLLTASGTVKVLATSREVLRIPGEVRHRVAPFEVPPDTARMSVINAAECVRLFLDRAQSRRAELRLTKENALAIVRLCSLVEGIPLAIEQAASHAEFLSPAQMVERFTRHLSELGTDDRGVIERHRTLWATIDWSYQMLTVDERTVLQRCAQFLGGWDINSLESICGRSGLAPSFATRSAQKLLDKSLIFVQEGEDQRRRFSMLQTVKEYLHEKDPPQIDGSFAYHFASAALDWCQAQDFESCEADLENLHISLDWLFDHDLEAACTTSVEMRRFWFLRGHFRSGSKFMQLVLSSHPPLETKALAANALGAMQMRLGEFDGAKLSYESSLSCWQSLGESGQQAMVLTNIAQAHAVMGELQAARELICRSIGLFEALGDDAGAASGQMILGRILIDMAEHELALSTLREAIPHLQTHQRIVNLVTAHANACLALFLLARDAAAREEAVTSLSLLEHEHDFDTLVLVATVIAGLAARAGDKESAERLATACVRWTRRSGRAESRIERTLLTEILPELSVIRPGGGTTSYLELLCEARGVCTTLTFTGRP